MRYLNQAGLTLALLATCIPALRAARVDPIVAFVVSQFTPSKTDEELSGLTPGSIRSRTQLEKEIETALYSHDGVLEAAVVGRQVLTDGDDRGEERRLGPQPDRFVHPREARGTKARALARGRPADAHPPGDARCHWTIAIAGADRSLHA